MGAVPDGSDAVKFALCLDVVRRDSLAFQGGGRTTVSFTVTAKPTARPKATGATTAMSFHCNTAEMEGYEVLNSIAAQKWWVIPTCQLEADAFINSLTCGLGISFDKFVVMFSALGLIRTKKSVVHVQRDRWEQFEGGIFRVNIRYCFCDLSRKVKRFTFIS